MSGDIRGCVWDLPGDPEFVAKARGMVRETLTEWGLPGPIYDVELMVSELYTNALVHGKPPIELALRVEGPVVRASITDHGPDVPHPTAVDSNEEHGRGLAIVAAYADKWGVDHLPEGAGKTVWFELESARAA